MFVKAQIKIKGKANNVAQRPQESSFPDWFETQSQKDSHRFLGKRSRGMIWIVSLGVFVSLNRMVLL